MSLRIRLRRMGKKKQPHYRIVATDSRAPRDGRFVEILGYYSPTTHPARLSVDLVRVDYWLGHGASVSSTVESLVSKARAGGNDRVALVDAASVAEAEAEAPAASENGAGAEAPETAVESAEAAETPEAATEPADAADGHPRGRDRAGRRRGNPRGRDRAGRRRGHPRGRDRAGRRRGNPRGRDRAGRRRGPR